MLRQLCLRGVLRQLPARATTAVWESSRPYSSSISAATLPDIDPSKLSITNTTTPTDPLPAKDLIFGKTFTGMIFEIQKAALLTASI
jgi:branched-chain amino acid aminotransferase